MCSYSCSAPKPGKYARDAGACALARCVDQLAREFAFIQQRELLDLAVLVHRHDALGHDTAVPIDVLDDVPDFPPHPLKKGQHYMRAGTISYELLTRLGSRYARLYRGLESDLSR